MRPVYMVNAEMLLYKMINLEEISSKKMRSNRESTKKSSILLNEEQMFCTQ